MNRVLILCLLSLCCIPAAAQKFALSTNALDYANLGTFNLEASYAVAQHWNLKLGGKYNPFKYGSDASSPRNMQRSVNLGTRYWFWHVYSGGWLGGHARYQEYNSGYPGNPETSEGDRFGGGFSGGYSMMLSSHLNIDFGVGFWFGYDLYTRYACRDCGRIMSSGGDYFILPDEILISLSYIF